MKNLKYTLIFFFAVNILIFFIYQINPELLVEFLPQFNIVIENLIAFILAQIMLNLWLIYFKKKLASVFKNNSPVRYKLMTSSLLQFYPKLKDLNFIGGYYCYTRRCVN